MNEQLFENERTTPATPRHIRLMIRGEIFRFDFDTAASLPVDNRFLIACGCMGKLDSRCLYRPQADGSWLRMSDGAEAKLPDEILTDEELRTLTDEGLSDALYCAKWSIAGEYPHGRYTFCDDKGNEIDL